MLYVKSVLESNERYDGVADKLLLVVQFTFGFFGGGEHVGRVEGFAWDQIAGKLCYI